MWQLFCHAGVMNVVAKQQDLLVREWMEIGRIELRERPVSVPVESLLIGDYPRISGENPDHVLTLAAVHSELPPIIVHRPTMRIMDGVHRLRVAKLLDQSQISVRFYDGDEASAFVLAVRSNITHGLPLSIADRKHAARRIMTSYPQWSDRMIASVAGIAPRTVAEIRMWPDGASAQRESRIGRDGRVRPVDASNGRAKAAALITDNPGLSLRQVALAAGISPETVRDVRRQLSQGNDPVSRRRKGEQHGLGRGRGQRIGRNPVVLVERLSADPALRHTETGRALLRLLYYHMTKRGEWIKIAEYVPLHCGVAVVGLARECAQIWQEFAERVERRLDGAA
jgi:ParB-like chromosome segregation protein Spo0J